jgi:two-component system, OmpR family, response regulator
MKLLLVEDEERVARMLARGLGEEGHQVDVVGTGLQARDQALAVPYDVVLLDWSLPDLDGVSVLREWRSRGLRTPVLLLTARGSTGEKVTGLRAGADDYLVKPFAFDELLARVEALHRRGGASDAFVLGAATLDARRRAIVLGAKAEPLTAREFALLSELASHAGEVLSRSKLVQTVWGPDFDGNTNVVDVYVGYLRTKLDRLGVVGLEIQAVRGVGYRLVVPSPAGTLA